MLLADVFEKFIKTCLEYYCLDYYCHYFSVSGLSFDAMLKMTRTELELISDITVHSFIEKGMRGGISYIYKRHSKVNDCGSEEKIIIYWDMNNFYGFAVIQPMPYSEFDFLTKKEIHKFCLNSVSENSAIGYILEIDLEYSFELHDIHNDYPLAPEKIEISSDMLSKYCSDIANKYGIKVGGVKKLAPSLRDKVKYIVHTRNLHLYLKLGSEID